MDSIYALPFKRVRCVLKQSRPGNDQKSITGHRGCFGGCAFCAITMHQGKQSSRAANQFLQNIPARKPGFAAQSAI
jgi:radical SAM superfamily enzyme YgiQ (UPF0313 family)